MGLGGPGWASRAGATASALCHVAAPDRRGRAAAALSGDSRTCPGARGEKIRVSGGEEDPDSEGSLYRHRGS